MSDDSLPDDRRRVVEAVAERAARETVRELLERDDRDGDGVSRRDALRIGGLGSLLATAGFSGTAAARRTADGPAVAAGAPESTTAAAAAPPDGPTPKIKNVLSAQWNRSSQGDSDGRVRKPAAPPKGTYGPAVTYQGTGSEDGTVFCFGGNQLGDPQLAAYDVTENTWSQRTAPTNFTSGGGAAIDEDGGVVYVATAERFFEYDIGADSWNPRAGTAWSEYDVIGTQSPALAFADDRVFRFGGRLNSAQPVVAYDPAADSWSTLDPRESMKNRWRVAALTYNNEVYVVGGKPGSQDPDGRVERYDPANGSWERLADMPIPNAAHGMTEIEGKLYAVGGFSVPTQVYDVANDTWDWYPGPRPESNAAPAVGKAEPNASKHAAVYAFGGRDAEERFRADLFGSVDTPGGGGDGDDNGNDG